MNWQLFAAFFADHQRPRHHPGPDRDLGYRDRREPRDPRALTTVAGTTLGNAVLLAAIAFGLSWVLENAAMLFDILRLVGAAYLIWLGVQAWRRAGANGAGAAPRGHVQFWRGVMVALSNPKSIASSRPSCRSSSIQSARRAQLAVMCAVSVALPQSPIPAGLSRPGWGGPGSYSRGGQSCSADCPV